MSEQNDERRVSEIARHAAQEALAMTDEKGSWQNTVLAIIGAVSLGGTVLFWVMDAQTDKKIEPLIRDIALIQKDYGYIKNYVEENSEDLESIDNKLDQLIQKR